MRNIIADYPMEKLDVFEENKKLELLELIRMEYYKLRDAGVDVSKLMFVEEDTKKARINIDKARACKKLEEECIRLKETAKEVGFDLSRVRIVKAPEAYI